MPQTPSRRCARFSTLHQEVHHARSGDRRRKLGNGVEGVKTARSVHDLAHRLGLDLPIHEAIYQILYEGLEPKAALALLSQRELKSEFQLH